MPSNTRKFTLGARVDLDRYRAFHLIAESRELTKSRLLGLLINDFLKLAPAVDPISTAPNKSKTVDLCVRLTPFQHDELRRLAASCHWHPGTYLRRLFDIHLTGKPQFTSAELHALYQVAEQLADMGRNINQIARALNTSLDNAHLAMAIPFEEMRMLLDLEKSFINDLATGSLTWGANDGR